MLYSLLIVLMVGLADPPAAVPQAPPAERGESARTEVRGSEAVPTDGFWPTPKMMNGLLLRWADELADKYDLTDEQAEQLRPIILDRWPAFFEERRPTLQPLINQFFEARMGREPPSRGMIQDWAERALPMYEDFQNELEESQAEIRETLDPVRQAKMDLDAMKMGLGLGVFEARLKAWKRGEFNEHEWWDPPARVRRARRHDRNRPPPQSENTAPEKAKYRVDEELLRWNLYVAEFVRDYELDDAQREAAQSILRECRQRALDHRDRFRARLEKLEKNAANEQPPSAEFQKETEAMYGPIAETFVELKNRLEQIPTEAQKAAFQKRTAPSNDADNNESKTETESGNGTDTP